MDDHVVLLEKTLQKNQEMITENQKLLEGMKAKDEERNRVLGRSTTMLETACDPNAKEKKGKIQVSSACRVSIYSYM